jgi:DNA-binding MarR family transcriptional regulator
MLMSRPAAPISPRYPALLELLRTAETIWNASRTFFAQWGLSPSQFNLLNLLSTTPDGRPQVEVSRELLMHRSNVTGLVDRLQARGLVERRPRQGDRRVNYVALTSAGRRLLRRVQPRYHEAAEEVWGGFPVDQLPPILTALRRLTDNANRMGEHLATRGRTARTSR